MSRDIPRGQFLRQRIAQAAAKLMAEHGIKDYALAKRKAARQLGASPQNGLPSNDEIDSELRSYLSLFEPDDHEQYLLALRWQAIDVMASLQPFDPVLTGAVALGTAALHADIELDVYADSSKEFEQYLLNRNIPFKTEERRSGSFFTLFSDPADVIVHVLPLQSMQSSPRDNQETRRRLTLAQLRQYMASNENKDIISMPVAPEHGI